MTTFAPRGCSTSWPSLARTSPSSPEARFCSPGSWESLAGWESSERWQRSAATSWQSGGSPRSCAQEWPERLRRWRGWPPGRAIAGTSCSWERPCSWRGTRTRCSSPASSFRSGRSGRSSSACRHSNDDSRVTPGRAGCALSLQSPWLVVSPRRRSFSCTSAPSRSTRCSPTPWRRPRSHRCSGSLSPRPRLSPCCPRSPWLSDGRTGAWPRTLRGAPASSAVFRTRRSRLQLRQSALPQSPRSSS